MMCIRQELVLDTLFAWWHCMACMLWRYVCASICSASTYGPQGFVTVGNPPSPPDPGVGVQWVLRSNRPLA